MESNRYLYFYPDAPVSKKIPSLLFRIVHYPLDGYLGYP